jgi:DNA-directed RNA polymerase specialized sigma24 family protein
MRKKWSDKNLSDMIRDNLFQWSMMHNHREEPRMPKEIICHIVQVSPFYKEGFWENLYEILRKPVTSFVRKSKLPSWVGQEDDIVKDIIQETVMRVYKKFLATPDEVFTIQSMEAFAYTIAYRYFLDLLRKEKRLSHLPRDQYGFEMAITAISGDEELDTLLEAMMILSVLTDAARIIAKLPHKQRRALLVDLARYNDFTEEPTLMEQAFAKVGIQLRDYCQFLPLDSSERLRHNSLVSLGYRRVRLDFQASSDDPQVARSVSSIYPKKMACEALSCG